MYASRIKCNSDEFQIFNKELPKTPEEYKEPSSSEQPKLTKTLSFSEPQFFNEMPSKQTQEKSPEIVSCQSLTLKEESIQKESNKIDTNDLKLSSIKAVSEPNIIHSSSTQKSKKNQNFKVSCFSDQRCELRELIDQILPDLPISQNIIENNSYRLNFAMFRKSKEEVQEEVNSIKKQYNVFQRMQQHYISAAELLIQQFNKPDNQGEKRQMYKINLLPMAQCKKKFVNKKDNIKVKKSYPSKVLKKEIQFYTLQIKGDELIKTLQIKGDELNDKQQTQPQSPEDQYPGPVPEASKKEEQKKVEKKIEPTVNLDFTKLYQQVDNKFIQQYQQQLNYYSSNSLVQPTNTLQGTTNLNLFAGTPFTNSQTANPFANNQAPFTNNQTINPFANNQIPFANNQVTFANNQVPQNNQPVVNIFATNGNNLFANNAAGKIFQNNSTTSSYQINSTATQSTQSTQSMSQNPASLFRGNYDGDQTKRYNTRSGRS